MMQGANLAREDAPHCLFEEAVFLGASVARFFAWLWENLQRRWPQGGGCYVLLGHERSTAIHLSFACWAQAQAVTLVSQRFAMQI